MEGIRNGESWVTWRSLALINLASIMERADEGLLPAVYREIGVAFHASPTDLGTLTFVRCIQQAIILSEALSRTFVATEAIEKICLSGALAQALSSPLAGFLALYYDRAAVVGVGTVFWAISTAAVGLSQTYWQCAIWRAINGVGLAIVVPAVQSFVADSYPESGRGFAFGWLNLVGTVGSIGGSMTATILAGHSNVLGLPGWRAAFIGMAVVSAIIGSLVYAFVADPRMATKGEKKRYGRKLLIPLDILSHPKGQSPSSPRQQPLSVMWQETSGSIQSVLSVRTFQLIVLQGLVGSIPWQAMVFFTMWLQLIGFDHNTTAILIGLFSTGCAFGALFGGWLGDRAAVFWPNGGRILCAQFSATMGIPFSFILLLCLPLEKSAGVWFGLTFLCGGLLLSWSQACANNPIFSEIVPANMRTTIYAFDRAFEGGLSAIAAPAVGYIAEKWYGYRADMLIPPEGSPIEARAIGHGLFLCMAIPWGLCALCYGTLYYTYSKDRSRALAREDVTS